MQALAALLLATPVLAISPLVAMGPLLESSSPLAVVAPSSKAVTATPGFDIVALPQSNAGEPSIGLNWRSRAAMFQAGLVTYRVAFDGAVSPVGAEWTRTDASPTNTTSIDPILFTDAVTGRTFVSQLIGVCSLMAFTDDDGRSWTSSTLGCGPGSGIDHQTVGAGPWHAPLPAPAVYPRSVYYCAQSDLFATCAVSLDGGPSFGPAVPIYTVASCSGLHGHVKVGPDGTAYVPNKNCGGKAAVVVSETNGATWAVRPVPDSSAGSTDASVGIGSNGKIYVCYAASDGHPRVAWSGDHGLTWSPSIDLGTSSGIRTAVFPAAMAGDDDRAACAFLGSTAAGRNSDSGDFPGWWGLDVATTYDGGATWNVQQATGADPVQRGGICPDGLACDCVGNVGSCAPRPRNLLDFIDAGIDAEGRIVVAFADGCVNACAQPEGHNSGSSWASIARQASGGRLFSAYDPADPPPATAPGVPSLGATSGIEEVGLTWSAPPNSGSPITAYRLYRGNATGNEELLAIVPASNVSYVDRTAHGNTRYYYQVAAVNGVGEGPRSNEVGITPIASDSEAPSPPTSMFAEGAHSCIATCNRRCDGDILPKDCLQIPQDGIDLRWAEPYSDGGAPLVEFRIYRGSRPRAEYTIRDVFPNTHSYRDFPRCGDEFWYYVTAINKVGKESLPSAEVHAISNSRTVVCRENPIHDPFGNALPDRGPRIGGHRP